MELRYHGMSWRERCVNRLTTDWKNVLAITFAHGFLRPLVPEDVHQKYVQGLNDPDVNEYLVSVREQIQTAETVQAFVRDNWTSPDAVLFGIWVDGIKLHCGTVRLHQINRNLGTAVLGICIFDKHVWGGAVGSGAIDAVTQWAFGHLNLDTIKAGAYLQNVASWKAFEKAGYTVVEDIAGRYTLNGKAAVVRWMVARRLNSIIVSSQGSSAAATPILHTGQIYAFFDRGIRSVESWLNGRVVTIGEFNEAIVAKRLVQRITEITLNPFVAILAKDASIVSHFIDGVSGGHKVDCGGLKICPVTGEVTLSLRLFVRELGRFLQHWGLTLGAILSGFWPQHRRGNLPATLVFGIGIESLFYQGNDARFVKYCREGPIVPLSAAQRLIVQCVVRKGAASDARVAYARFPLHALLRDTAFGFAASMVLLWRHVQSVWIFLRAVVTFPLLVLLGRDIAYAAAVRALDTHRMIEAVVLTNSVYLSQPLWMRGPSARSFQVHMVWYSQNVKPLVYARPRPHGADYGDEPRCRHINVDEMWAWTQGFNQWLRDLGFAGPIHVGEPILFYLPEVVASRKKSNRIIRVAVCDVTPLQDDVALRIGLAENYYNGPNMMSFIEDIRWVGGELEKHTGKRVVVSLKHKRNYNRETHSAEYIQYIAELSKPGGGIDLIPFGANLYSFLSESDLVIVPPYSSPTFIASRIGVPAVYFDPTETLVPTFEPAPFVTFASGRAELLRAALAAISTPSVQGICSGS